MRKFLLAAVAALALAPSLAFAQSATQQTATHADAATFLQAQAGSAACNTVNTTVANGTVTITPPGSQYVYITGIYIDVEQDATGETLAQKVTSTNITGSPV